MRTQFGIFKTLSLILLLSSAPHALAQENQCTNVDHYQQEQERNNSTAGLFEVVRRLFGASRTGRTCSGWLQSCESVQCCGNLICAGDRVCRQPSR